jgi:hypothetical protein
MSDIIVHEGKKYRKVDRKASVGDRYLIITRATGPHFTEGKVYAITEFYKDLPEVVDNSGTKIPIIDSRYVVLEPVAVDLYALESELAAMKAKVAEMERQLAEAKAANRLKVGDYAKIADGIDDGYAKSGDIVEIIDTGSLYDFQVRKIGDKRNYTLFDEKDLCRATDEEVAEAKRKLARDEIQPGVYVKLQIPDGARPRYGWGDAKNGDVGKVKSRNDDEAIVDFPSHSGWRGLLHEFVLVTDEGRKQAEETAKWAAIGRKPGEFKVGDVVRIDSYNFVGKVEDVGDALLGIRGYGGSYRGAEKDDVELIAPVESVVNLRGGDVA